MPNRTYSFRMADTAECTELFERMTAEGLTGCALYALPKPTLAAWLKACSRAATVCALDARSGEVCAFAQFVPSMGRMCAFDFCVFRKHFAEAARMSRCLLSWWFARGQYDCVLGITPVRNRHARNIAEAAGFRFAAFLPGACFMARRGRFEAGALFTAVPESVAQAERLFPQNTADRSAGHRPAAGDGNSGRETGSEMTRA